MITVIMVNKKDPAKSRFVNHESVGVFMWGRLINQYMLETDITNDGAISGIHFCALEKTYNLKWAMMEVPAEMVFGTVTALKLVPVLLQAHFCKTCGKTEWKEIEVTSEIIPYDGRMPRTPY